MAENHIGVLFTAYPDRHKPTDPGGPGWKLDYTLTHIPWPRINAVWFLIDNAHTNPMAAAGAARTPALNADTLRRIRATQELGVAAPIRSGITLSDGGTFRDSIDLAAFATALLWITPYSPDAAGRTSIADGGGNQRQRAAALDIAK